MAGGHGEGHLLAAPDALPDFVLPAKDGGWRVLVWAQPGAKRDELAGVLDGRLKVKLRAPAVDNKANAGLLGYLAKLLELPKSGLELEAGHTNRRKTVRIRAGLTPAWPSITRLEGNDRQQ